jgi:hypothetical protein
VPHLNPPKPAAPAQNRTTAGIHIPTRDRQGLKHCLTRRVENC